MEDVPGRAGVSHAADPSRIHLVFEMNEESDVAAHSLMRGEGLTKCNNALRGASMIAKLIVRNGIQIAVK
jgi:hypothetical protein